MQMTLCDNKVFEGESFSKLQLICQTFKIFQKLNYIKSNALDSSYTPHYAHKC